MEAITPDPVLPVEVLRQGVAIGRRGHGLVEGGIENRHLGYSGEEAHRHLDTLQVGRVMQGRQGDHVANDGDDPLIHPGRALEGLAAMDHPMADGHQFTQIRQHPGFAQPVGHKFQSRAMMGDRQNQLETVLPPALVPPATLEIPVRLADAVDGARRQHLPVIGLEELIFNRRATGIENQNLHETPRSTGGIGGEAPSPRGTITPLASPSGPEWR